ncbi:hypothetical protein CALVIDRAFT_561280 [Calocera viscosa TUFC12733]|uniref:Methyltransferase type 11 domain-containing protein n=1 Tax=Calocera viscosa (strain TUFC12733) TaxID=1330018 RepID=A0A167Q537_CALVF|nr:hypothetical protein CALVIDRAFT_561280 [Calocera viscosa TUFC12733]
MSAPTPSTRLPHLPPTFPYPPSAFSRHDPTPDAAFYAHPRIGVQHLSPQCITLLTSYYTSVLPPPSHAQPPRVLDLCSSWTSHLPPSFSPPQAHITGLGLSGPELEANPLLTERVVHDLNASPSLPPSVGSDPGGVGFGFDAVLCSVSVDYLSRPLEVFRELARVTRHGAKAHMSFSNRCFPTKVIRRWLEVGEEERCELVACYFHFAGTGTGTGTGIGEGEGRACEPGELWEDVQIVTVLEPSSAGDPLWVVRGTRTANAVPGA